MISASGSRPCKHQLFVVRSLQRQSVDWLFEKPNFTLQLKDMDSTEFLRNLTELSNPCTDRKVTNHIQAQQKQAPTDVTNDAGNH